MPGPALLLPLLLPLPPLRLKERKVLSGFASFAFVEEQSDADRFLFNQLGLFSLDIGQRTLLDLLDSENEFFTARSTYINGKFIEMGARYRILNAMGQLLTTLDVAPPEQAMVQTR